MLPPAAPLSETPVVLPWISWLAPIVAVVIAGAGDAGRARRAGDTGVDPLDVDAVGQGDADATDGAVADVRVGRSPVAATRVVDGGVPAPGPPGSTVSPNGSPHSLWLVSSTMPPS